MTKPEKPSFWGKGVWLIYGVFVLFILSLVGWAAAQRFELVEPDYYEQGLAYQNRIDGVRRTLTSGESPTAAFDSYNRLLTICFASLPNRLEKGTIHFFRPSNAQSDFTLPLTPDSTGCQRISDGRLQQGQWRLKYEWTSDGQPRYWEDVIFLEF